VLREIDAALPEEEVAGQDEAAVGKG